MRATVRMIAAAALLIASTLQAFGAYQFSEYNFARNPAIVDNQLRVEMRGRPALRSYRFLRVVGGVNFETHIELSGHAVVLDYDPNANDGNRATAVIDGKRYSLPLYDWELAPIVSYADSEYTAVVSIFGEGPDMENYYYVRYHPAFEDTHLGMRLVQSDIFLMDPITFGEAPKIDGEAAYYPGEPGETEIQVRFVAAQRLGSILSAYDYQAWVLTDNGLSGTLSAKDGVLQINLQPFYHFWNSEPNALVVEKYTEYNKLFDQYEPLARRFDVVLRQYRAAPVDSAVEAQAEAELRLLTSKLEPIADRIEDLEAKLDALRNQEPNVMDVTELTAAMKEEQPLLDEAVPFVSNAVKKTAGYAAFFRGVKASNLVSWQAFKAEVGQEVRLVPVETPNQFLRRPQ